MGRIRASRAEGGFSLIELLVVVGLLGLLLTLGATAFRRYWLVQSLDGAQDELIAQVRQRQEQAVSESHPLVFGVRVLEGSSEWGILEYTPDNPLVAGNQEACVQKEILRFSTSVQVSSAAFATSPETTFCASVLGAASDYVFFYPRGSATGGTLTLLHPEISAARTIVVSPITGRVQQT